MNKIYRVIYNKSTQTFQAVNEFAKSQGKSASATVGSVGEAVSVPESVRHIAKLTAVALGIMTVTNPAMAAVAIGSTTGTNTVNTAGATATQLDASAVGRGSRADSEGSSFGASTNTGARASAVGYLANASSVQTVAIGYKAAASGSQATAVGSDSVASGSSSVAIGGDDLDDASKFNTDTAGTGGTAGTGAVNSGTLNTQFKAISGVDLVNMSVPWSQTTATTQTQYVSTNASGQASVAIGVQAVSSGHLSTVVGTSSQASGLAATAVGVAAKASGRGAFAAAAGAEAQGGNSIAIGTNTLASSNDSIAIGDVAEARSVDSISIGHNATGHQSAIGTVLIGANTKINGTAFNINGTARQANNRLVGGSASETGDLPTTVIGYNATSNSNHGDTLVGAWAKSGNDKFYTKQHTALGARAYAYGDQTLAIGADSLALGNASIALGGDDIDAAAVGIANALGLEPQGATETKRDFLKRVTSKMSSFAGEPDIAANTDIARRLNPNNLTPTQIANGVAGYIATASLGDASVTIGTSSQSYGVASTAIGMNALSKGDNSVALGTITRASGKNAIAIGVGSNASGSQSIAIGVGNQVSGNNAGAFGDPNTVSGNNSYAFGNDNTVSTDNTFVMGNNITTTVANSVVLGNKSATVASGTSTKAMDAYATDTVAGQTLNFAGGTPTGLVSVGSATETRRIQGVSAGLISATSTDAINGSQLYAVVDKLNKENYFHVNPNENPVAASGSDNNAAVDGIGNATGGKALAAGFNATASGKASIAIGDKANADNLGGIAIGQGAVSATADRTENNGLDKNGTPLAQSSEGVNKAIAIGNAAQATHSKTVAIGDAAAASGKNAVAIGSQTKSTGAESTVVGSAAESHADFSVAIGQRANVTASGFAATAIGNLAIASGGESVALGRYANSSASQANAIGYNATASGQSGVAMGTRANASAVHSVAISTEALATADQAIAIGRSAKSLGGSSVAIGNSAEVAEGKTNSVAIGWDATVTGSSAVALGRQANATFDNAVSIGSNANALNGSATAIGQRANATHGNAIAMGTDSKALNANTVAIGRDANASLDGSVALGHGSATTAATRTQGATVNGVSYGFVNGSGTSFAGANTNTNYVVSVGKAGAERQIQNVAAGRISDTSTDAINGSQLYMVADKLAGGWAIANATDKVGDVKIGQGNQVKFVGEGDTNVAVTQDATNGQYTVKISSTAAATPNNYFHVNPSATATTAVGTNNEAPVDGIGGATGGYALAAGFNAKAGGDTSVAIGKDAATDTKGAIAIGDGATVTVSGTTIDGGLVANGGIAIGTGSRSNHQDTIAMGTGASATNRNAAAIGTGASATVDDATAIGAGSQASGPRSIALSKEAKAAGGESIALGYQAEAKSFGTALGSKSKTEDNYALAVGYEAQAIGQQSTAVGYKANTTKEAISGIAVGQEASAQEDHAMAMGYQAVASDERATAIGDNARASAVDAIAQGSSAQAIATNAIATGKSAIASEENAMAQGTGAKAFKADAIAQGTNAQAVGDSAVAIGKDSFVGSATHTPEQIQAITDDYNNALSEQTALNTRREEILNRTDELTAEASRLRGQRPAPTAQIAAINAQIAALGTELDEINEKLDTADKAVETTKTAFDAVQGAGVKGIAIGDAAKVYAENGLALGAGASVADGLANAVALGANSTVTAVTAAPDATINGVTYGNFAGNNPSAGDVVSVGSAGKERRIQNVAAGRITADSTDAINGSQLYAVVTTGSWQLQHEGKEVGDVNWGDKVNFTSADKSVTITPTNETGGVSGLDFKVNTDGTTIKVDPNTGVVTANTTELPDTNNDGKVEAPTNNGGALVNATTVANAINNSGFTAKAAATADGKDNTAAPVKDTGTVVNPGETVTFEADKNLEVTQTVETNGNTKFSFKTKDDVTFNKVTSNTIEVPTDVADKPITINNNGMDMADKPITNVAGNLDGAKDGTTAPTTVSSSTPTGDTLNNAATVGDVLNAGWNLKHSDGTTTTDKDFVRHADNVVFANGVATTASVETDGTTSTIKFDVKTDGTTIKVDDAGNITANTGDLTNTDGKVNTPAGDEANKLTTAGDVANAINESGFKLTATKSEGEVEGTEEHLIKSGELMTVDAGKNIKLTQADGKITVATKKDVSFDSVTVGTTNPITINDAGINMNDKPITNINNGLTNGANDLRNLDNNAVDNKTAATVGDLRNMGWVVSSNKTTGATTGQPTDTAFSQNVKNANEVQFVGTGIAKVSGDVKDGKNVITVHVDETPAPQTSNITADATSGQIGVKNGDTVNTNPTENPNNLVTANDVVNAVNNAFWKVGEGEGATATKKDDVKAGDTVNFAKGEGTTVSVTNTDGETTTVKYNADVDGTTVKIGDDGKITANTTTLTDGDNDGKIDDVANDNKGNLVTAQNVADAINSSGFKLTATKSTGDVEGASEELINPSDTVTIDAGDNIKLTQDKGKITVATKKDVTFDNVTSNTIKVPTDNTNPNNNPITIDSTGIDMADKPITNVAGNLDGAKKDTTAPTTVSTSTPAGDTLNNAATVGDVLNAGWNLKHSDGTTTTDKDFVRHADNVVFANGVATTASVETDGTTSTIKFDVKTDGTTIKVDDAGNITANTGDLTNNQTTGAVNTPSEEDGKKLTTVADVADAINNSGFRVKSAGTNKADGDDATERLVKTGELVEFEAGDNLTVKRVGDKFTYATASEVKFDKVTVGGDTNPLTITSTPSTAGGNPTNTISNLTSNLAPTTSNADGDLINKDGTDGKTEDSKPTTSQAAPTNAQAINNNAATVGDVLNAGWNLQGNGEAKDFVKPYDTVNFVDGKGTKAVVESDGTTSTIKVDIDNGTITANDNGSVTGPVTDELKKAVEDAKKALDADPNNQALKDDLAKAEQNLTNAGNQVATAQNVADAINKSGFNLKTSATAEGTKENGTANDGELINPSDTVEMIAGKNLTVKQDADGKVTYATKEEVDFNKVTVSTQAPVYTDKNTGETLTKQGDKFVNANGDEVAADNVVTTNPNAVNLTTKEGTAVNNAGTNQTTANKPNELNIAGDNNSLTQITGVGSTLNTTPVEVAPQGDKTEQVDGKAPTSNLVDLANAANPTSAATVGDLQNMGWVVSASGNEYKDTVKNANQVNFVGEGRVSVTGETKDGVREIKVAIQDQVVDGTERKNDVVNYDNGSNTVANVNDVYNYKPSEDEPAQELTKKADGNYYDQAGNVVNNVDETKLTPVGYAVSYDVVTGETEVPQTGDNKGKAEVSNVTAAKEALQAAQNELETAKAGNDQTAIDEAQAKVDAAQKAVDGINNAVATVGDIVETINNVAWYTNSTTATGGATDTGIKAGGRVNLEAGKNMEVTQTVDPATNTVSYTYSTKEEVDFNKVTVSTQAPVYTDKNTGETLTKQGDKFVNANGDEVAADNVVTTNPNAVNLTTKEGTAVNNAGTNQTTANKPNELNIAGDNNSLTQITGVGSTLNTTPVEVAPQGDKTEKVDGKAPTSNLVDLANAANPTSAATVGDLQNMGWVVSASGNEYKDTVKNANEVKFVGTGLATVVGETVNGIRTITVDVNAQSTVENAQLPVVYTNAQGDKVYKQVDAQGNVTFNTKPDGKGDVVQPADVIASMNNGSNSTTAPMTLSNVASNLAEVTPVNEKQPDANSIANLEGKKNNAATVADVLNAGWNLQNNGSAMDTVTHSDAVNFVDGRATTVSVEANEDGTVNNIKVDVETDDKSITVSEDGKLTAITNEIAANPNGSVGTQLQEELKKAQEELAALPDTATEAEKKAAQDKVDAAQTAVNNASNALATAQNVADAINKSGFNLKTSATAEGAKEAGTADNGELINPSDTVEMVAGKNLTVKQDANGKVTYATKEEVDFNKVTVSNGDNLVDGEGNKVTAEKDPVTGDTVYKNAAGDIINANEVKPANTVNLVNEAGTKVTNAGTGQDAAKPAPSALNITGTDAAGNASPTQITGVASTLNTTAVEVAPQGDKTEKVDGKAPTSNLVDLANAANPTSAATVGDLQNMGWVVSASGNEYKDTVKNANEVKFVGTGLATVVGETVNGIRTITVDVNAQSTVETAQLPVVYTNAQGDKVYKQVDAQGNVTFNTKPDGKGDVVQPADVIASMNNGSNSTTAPMALSNVASNLAEVTPVNEKQPDANSIANLEGKKNNAATVADVLNAGWNLQNNGSAMDTVTHSDAVNFVDGRATTVSVEANEDGTVNNIKVDVETDDKSITVSENGKLTAITNEIAANPNGSVGTQLQEELKKAQEELAALPDTATPEQKQAAQDKVDAAQTAVNNANNALATAQNVVDAINKSGFNLKTSATAEGAKATDGTANDGELINPSDTVEMIAGKNLTVKQDANGKVTYATKNDVQFNSVQFGDNTGPKITNDGNNIKVGDKDGNATSITNVKSNLTPVTPADEKQPDANSIANLEGKKNNAATVEDVLNAGWNLQNNDTAVDTVTHNDTVNFVDGRGTTVSVTPNEDGTANDIKVDVETDDKTITVGEDGKLTAVTSEIAANPNGSVGTQLQEELKKAQEELAALPDTATEAEKKAAQDKVDAAQTAVNNASNALATAQNVADAINKSGFNLKTSATAEGAKENGTANDGELINPSDTVEMVAGKNLTVKQDANGKVTYATQEEVDFNKVTISNGDNLVDGEGNKVTAEKDPVTGDTVYKNEAGDIINANEVKPANTVNLVNEAGTKVTNTGTGQDANKPAPSALNITGTDAEGNASPTQITGVASTLNTKAVDTAPTGTGSQGSDDLVDLKGDTNNPVNPTSAATVGDLQNMGWVVSASGNEYKDTVKNANEVKFVGTGLATVVGETVNGIRTITVDVNAQSTVENAQLPVVYTNAQGDKVYKQVDAQGNVTFNTKPDGKGDVVQPADVIASMNNGSNSTTAPMALSNVASNLVDITPVNEKQPDANSIANLEGKKNNAATVADVLNAGWNLQNNDTAIDTVTHNDAVNFVDGRATTVSVEANEDGTVNNIKVDVETDDKSITVSEDGKLTAITNEIAANPNGSVGTQLQEELKKAQEELAALPDTATPEQKQAAQDKVDAAQTAVNNANNALATAQNVVDAINKSGFNLKTSATAEGAKATDGTANDGELINPSDTVEMIAGKNLTVKQDANGKVTYATQEDVNFNSVQFGDIATGPKITHDGTNIKVGDVNGKATKITNVANGDISPVSNEAINGGQLNNYAKVNGNNVNVANGSINIVNGNGTTVTTNNAGEIKVNVNSTDLNVSNGSQTNANGSIAAEGTLIVQDPNGTGANYVNATTLANAVNNVSWKVDSKTDAVTANTATKNTYVATGNTVKAGEKVNINAGRNIEISGSGKDINIAVSDNPEFNNVVAKTSVTVGQGDTATVIKSDANGMSVAKADGSPQRITNVSNGVADNDAVNVSQLKGVANQLNNKINQNKREARAGIAGSNAAAGLPQVYIPGKSMVAASVAGFKGEGALAVGYSRASDNGKVILKLQGNANTRGDVGGSVGVGYQW